MTETWDTWPDLPDVPPPEPRCPMCERPGSHGGTCTGCEQAQADKPDDPDYIRWWLAQDTRTRRRLLALQHGTDPWTGKPYQRQHEQAEVTDDSVAVTRSPVHAAAVPRTSWDLG